MLGIQGTGPYGKLRALRDANRLDRQYMESGVPEPHERKELERSIARNKEEIRKILARLKSSKKR